MLAPAGTPRDIVLKLAATSDVLLENNRPGALEAVARAVNRFPDGETFAAAEARISASAELALYSRIMIPELAAGPPARNDRRPVISGSPRCISRATDSCAVCSTASDNWSRARLHANSMAC